MADISGKYNADDIGISLGPWKFIYEQPDDYGRTVWFGKEILLPSSLSTGVLFGRRQTPLEVDYPSIAPSPYYRVEGQLTGQYRDLEDLNPDLKIYEVLINRILDPNKYTGHDFYYSLYVNFTPGGQFLVDNWIYDLSDGVTLGAMNPIYVKEAGEWKPSIFTKVKNGDTWGDYIQMFVKDNGVWKPRI